MTPSQNPAVRADGLLGTVSDDNGIAPPAAAGPGLRLVRRLVTNLPRGKVRIARMLSRVMKASFVDTVEPAELGARLVIDPRDPFQLEMWLGTYQPHVVSFLRHNVRPGATVLAAGLHIGYVAVLAARLASRNGRVFSAEPDPAARDAARRSLELLDAQCAVVRVLPAGLSDSNGSLTINLSATLGQSSFAAPHHPRTTEVVPLRRGDEWLAGEGVTSVDVLILDVEGWECHALRGLERVLAGSPRLVALIEVSEWALREAGCNASALFDWLRAHGFELTWAEQVGGRYGVTGAAADAQHIRAGDVLCVKGGVVD